MIAELQFLKDLLFENLPMGDNKKHIEEYFSCLEKAIYTNEPIEREQFPPDDPAISGTRTYKYHSSTAFKELASRPVQSLSGQDMDHTESKQEKLSTAPDLPSTTENVAHLQEHSSRCQPDPDGRIDDPNLFGQLDGGCPCELCDGNVQDT